MATGFITRRGGRAAAPEGPAATFVAKDKLKIGDIVYTIDGDIDVPFYTGSLSSSVFTAVFSPDGATLILGGNFTGYAKRYTVSGTTITYTNDIFADAGTTALDGGIYTAAFSPDGNTLVLGGWFTGYAKRYTVSGTTITFTSDIFADTVTPATALNNDVLTAAFSPNGATLVLGGIFTGKAKRYTVSGTTITYTSDIFANAASPAAALADNVRIVAFSPNGDTLILGAGGETTPARRYTVSGTTITYTSDIYADAGTTPLNGDVFTAAFSPNGETLILGGTFTGSAKRYTVSGTTITYTSDIFADAGTPATALEGWVESAAFSPDGTTLVLGGVFPGYAKRYTVSGTTITYTSDIFADANGTLYLDTAAISIAFSPNGATLVLGGGGETGYAKRYTVSGTTITYTSDIYADAGTAALDSEVRTAVFSPNGTTLILVGLLSGGAKYYTVSGTTITYISDIYADTGTTALDTVYTAAFSPDGATLVLGGFFAGRAKRYTVSGTTITFTSNIFADAGTTALDSGVNAAAFSPDGATLVLVGFFTGFAKRYTVSGTTITFTSNIFANSGTTALNNVVYTVTFSPDGLTLVLGGNFTGFAKRYTVSGTTITFTNNILANAFAEAINTTVFTAVFSPDGATLILGGNFTGRAKRYTVSGTTITFTSNIFADAGTTALDSGVNAAAFSPNSATLILGGNFTGFAKRYTVSGTTITFTSDIFADAGTTALSGGIKSPAFSPDGTTLILGGWFAGSAKRYTVSGTTVTYFNQAYLLKSLDISVLNNIRSFNSGIAYVTSNAEINENVNVNILSR
jgi:WD40 repeat protein